MSLVSVIVVSHNSASYLASCLTSIASQRDIKHEIIVVDNASTDTTRVLVREYAPGARLLENERNRGFAAAVNQGLKGSRGRYVLLLNPDAALLPSSLTTLVDFLETTPNAAAVGPRQWLSSMMTWQWSIVPRMPVWRLILQRYDIFRSLGLADSILTAHWALNRTVWRRDQPCRVPFLSGACLLIKRQALDHVGGLDEGYFLFGEDVDLCARLTSCGWTLFAVPEAGAVHRGFHSVGVAPREGRRHLMASTARYLCMHESVLTRVIWSLMARRRSILTRYHGEFRVSKEHTDHHQAKNAHGTPPWWVEVGLEPLFLYGAAAVVDSSTVVLPEQLAELVRHGPLYVRMASIESDGNLGIFSPQRALRTGTFSMMAAP